MFDVYRGRGSTMIGKTTVHPSCVPITRSSHLNSCQHRKVLNFTNYSVTRYNTCILLCLSVVITDYWGFDRQNTAMICRTFSWTFKAVITPHDPTQLSSTQLNSTQLASDAVVTQLTSWVESDDVITQKLNSTQLDTKVASVLQSLTSEHVQNFTTDSKLAIFCPVELSF